MNNANIPNWARKPYHPKKVVASKQGWIVEETGEILIRVRDLDKKMAEYLGAETIEFKDNTIVVSNEVENPEATKSLVLDGQGFETVTEAPVDANVNVATLPNPVEEKTLEKPNTGVIADQTTEPAKRKPGRPRKENKGA